jgi:hypothetical protein
MDDVPRPVDATSDGQLLERTRAGDREAFGVLYERRHELVLAFLLKRTRNPEVAMDLMAETFAAALLALADRLPAIDGSAAPWLRQRGGPPQCASSIARSGTLAPAIPHGLHTPIALTARRLPGGYDLQVTFAAPAAVTNASTAYGVQVTRPSSSACGRGGVWGQSIERDVARGQIIHISEFVPQPPGCHGVVHGQVLLGGGEGALRLLGRDETIGRFSFRLP